MKKLILLLPFFFLSTILFAQDLTPVPELERRVTDLTSTLSSGELNALDAKLASLEEAKGSQVAVLIVPSTQDETIEQYGIRVADQWKLGREGVDDGVLFLVAMDDRKMRIEVGYGLEGAITDALSKRIITNVVTPEFRSGHYFNGIDNGVDVLISAINGEELPPAVHQQPKDESASDGWLIPLLVFGFIASGILKTLLSKKIGKGKATGVIAILILVIGWLVIGLVGGLVISFIVLIFTSIPTRGGRGVYWGGGGFGRAGGDGSGFGGFSGGGGGFGGGGASGGW